MQSSTLKKPDSPTFGLSNKQKNTYETASYMLASVPDIEALSKQKLSGRSPYQHIHSLGVVCPACSALELEAMESSFADLPFSSAFTSWIDRHKPFIQARTLHDYYQYANALMDFFEATRLKDIGIGAIRGFQMWRSHVYAGNDTMELPIDSKLLKSKYRHSAGNVRIKNEINCVLKPMLREAGKWAEIEEKKFKHLPVPREGSGVALSREQWSQILGIALGQRRWMVAGHCLQIMLRGGFGFGELRRVRRRDLDIEGARLTIVEGAKNGERERTVELTPSALDSANWLVSRWHKLGGTSPAQYLLPLRGSIRDKTLNRPMVSINFAWNAIKREWMVRQPKQARSETRQYDARVSAATMLLKNPKISLPTIEKALGWTPSSAMRKRYYRAEQDMLREALRTLEDGQ